MITFRRLAAVLLMLLPCYAGAQAPEFGLGVPLASKYDVQSAAYIYCATTGENGAVWGASIPSNQAAKVTTVASSTTISAVTASTNPFSAVSVGDELEFPFWNDSVLGRQKQYRVVTARASADSITIDAAIDLSVPTTGYQFFWRKRNCGTTATDGWIPTSPYMQVKITWELNTLGATTIDWRIECRDIGVDNLPIQVWGPGATGYPAAGITVAGIVTGRYAVYIPENWYECRVGSKLTGGAGTQSVTIKISGRQRQANQ